MDKGRKRSIRRLTIYGQVVITITVLSLFFFLSFGVIFRSVNERYIKEVREQRGYNYSSIVEGALYHSMLANDRSALENTLDVINTLPGIEDVNMYDSQDKLVYSSFTGDLVGHGNPECTDCHSNLDQLFSRKKKTVRIINMDNECEMSIKDHDYRLLMIKSPILNQPACYTTDCHAHSKDDQVLGSFVIRIPLEDLDTAVMASSRNFYLFGGMTTLFLAAFLLFFTRRNINRPLNEIILASEAVSDGDRSTRIDVESFRLHDIQLVSSAFNKMLDNLQSTTEELQEWSNQLEEKVKLKSLELTEMQNELIHVERVASLGKLSSSVAHEINNPLSGVLTYTKLVNKQLSGSELSEESKEPMLKYLKVIEDETKRCGEIVKGLLDFSRKDQVEYAVQNLHKILEDTFQLMEHQMKMGGIQFRMELFARKDRINCAENQIKQACIAILMNAFEAVADNGEVVIRTINPDATHILLEVEDNGVGISKDDLPKVFEPFYSAKEKVSGIGLGLSIVHGIIKSHNGNVILKSELSRGTLVSIHFPLSE